MLFFIFDWLLLINIGLYYRLLAVIIFRLWNKLISIRWFFNFWCNSHRLILIWLFYCWLGSLILGLKLLWLNFDWLLLIVIGLDFRLLAVIIFRLLYELISIKWFFNFWCNSHILILIWLCYSWLGSFILGLRWLCLNFDWLLLIFIDLDFRLLAVIIFRLLAELFSIKWFSHIRCNTQKLILI